MPQSKKRHHHHPSHPQPHQHVTGNQQHGTRSSRLINAGMVFFAILGLLGSYFTAGSNVIWLITGTAGGAIIGYFFARQMNKTFSR